MLSREGFGVGGGGGLGSMTSLACKFWTVGQIRLRNQRFGCIPKPAKIQLYAISKLLN